MKATLLLLYALTMLSGVFSVTVPQSIRAEDQVSITFGPASPPSDITIEPVSSKPVSDTPMQINYKVTELACYQPTSAGPANPGDCQVIWQALVGGRNSPVTIPPLFSVTYSFGSCVFHVTNRNSCGTISAIFGDFIPFLEFMITGCIASGLDSVINGDQPPALMTLAGVATTPNYTVDTICANALFPLRLGSSPNN